MNNNGFYHSENILAGIDLSLRNTGIVIINSKGEILFQELVKGDKINGVERLKYIKDVLIKRLNEFNVKKVAIEGYSFRSLGQTFSLGEIGGVVRLALFENDFTFFDIPPASLKSFLTNNGNADKLMVQHSIEKAYKIYFKNDNLADAYGLCRMLLCFGDETSKYCKKGGSGLIRKLRQKLEKENKTLI